MPNIPIVDEKDGIIDFKDKKFRTKDDIYRISSLWIMNSKGEILLAQRHKSKMLHPNTWWPAVAGTVDEQETYKETIIRETEEELGLKNIEFQLWPKVRIKDDYWFFCQWFVACVDKDISEFIPQETEVQALRWINSNELLREYKKSPEIYIPSMKNCLELFVINK